MTGSRLHRSASTGLRPRRIFAVAAVLLFTVVAHAQQSEDPPRKPAAQDASVISEAARGVAGRVEIAYSGGRLVARPVREGDASILVRVLPAGPDRFAIEFLGLVSGTYDLAQLLELDDGRPATGLAPIPVRVSTGLPPGHGTDVFGLQVPGFGISAHYRTIMFLAAGVWLLVPVVAVSRWLIRRPRAETLAPPAPEPTTRDLLRAVIESARDRDLSIPERARLELLLLRALREGRGSPEVSGAVGGPATAKATADRSSPAELARVMAMLREGEGTSGLVRAIEAWLHAADDPADPAASRQARAQAALTAVGAYATTSHGGRP